VECDSGIAYLVLGHRRLANAAHDAGVRPVRSRAPALYPHFGLDGQQPGSVGDAPIELHGPISTGRAGNRVYFGYGTNKDGVVQIVDREKFAVRSARADAREPALSRNRPPCDGRPTSVRIPRFLCSAST